MPQILTTLVTAVTLGFITLAAPGQAQNIAVMDQNRILIADGQAAGILPATLYSESGVGGEQTRSFMILNESTNANLQVYNMTITGPHAADFTGSLPGLVLTPHEIRTFDLKFKPLASGTRNATVTIFSNDPDSESAFSFDVSGVAGDVFFAKPNLAINFVDVTAKPNKKTGTHKVTVKLATSNLGGIASTEGIVVLSASPKPFFDNSAEPVAIKSFKNMNPPKSGKPAKFKKLSLKYDSEVSGTFLYAHIYSAEPEDLDYDWSNNADYSFFGLAF